MLQDEMWNKHRNKLMKNKKKMWISNWNNALHFVVLFENVCRNQRRYSLKGSQSCFFRTAVWQSLSLWSDLGMVFFAFYLTNVSQSRVEHNTVLISITIFINIQRTAFPYGTQIIHKRPMYILICVLFFRYIIESLSLFLFYSAIL